MTIDTALSIVLDKLDDIMIPAKESAKIEEVKGGIRAVIASVQNARVQEQQQAQQKEQEEKRHED